MNKTLLLLVLVNSTLFSWYYSDASGNQYDERGVCYDHFNQSQIDYRNCNECCCKDWFLSNTLFVPHGGYAIGESIGVDEDYGNIGFFALSPFCDDYYLLTQADAYVLERSCEWAYSLGIGFRSITPCDGPVWGFNGFYDFRQRDETHNLHQFGLGFEALSLLCCLDFRANFYFPVWGVKYSKPIIYSSYIGDFSATCRERDRAPCAMNAEVGVPWYCGCLMIYPAIGPYFLSFPDECTTGVRFRTSATLGGWLWAEVLVTNDSIYDTNVQGKFTLAIPFSLFSCKKHCECLPCYPSPYTTPVNRFDIIPIDRCCDYDWNW